MTASHARPSPDALLRRVRAETERTSHAHLKIFFGFAPGVGKTFAMLESAHRLKAQGVDVVVGAALTHGRRETEELLSGLEQLSPRRVSYRGQTLEEFDLDAALARKPAVLILDELAHSNAPESRHRKRWQDVLELLDAGTTVHTTLNVQHVESLNDVVAQITGIQVRETVPDALLERADEIELVDVSPEDLLKRLQDGKVYLGDQAARAMQNFFQRGNLLALRELALRRTADRVNLEVQAYREEHDVSDPWPTADRILVCVGPSPASSRLVRAARRMAAGLRAPWVAAYVESPGVRALTEADEARLESHLRLAELLGASVVRLSGLSISEAILEYARRNNVARIIVGKPTHWRPFDWIRGSVIEQLVRGSGQIDVLVISGDLEERRSVGSSRPASEPSEPSLRKYAWSVALVGLTTAVALTAYVLFSIPDLEMLYLIAVMISAISFGRGPSLATAALSIAAYDFCFVPPRFTFSVADGKYLLSFVMMFAVGLVISTLALRIKRQQTDAILREERTASLYALSRDLGAATDSHSSARVVAEHTARAFNADAVVVTLGTSGDLAVLAKCAPDTELSASDAAVARWVLDHRRIAGLGSDTLPASNAICAPLLTATTGPGALVIVPRARQPLTSDQRSFLEAICRQASFALDRAELSDKARAAALRAKDEELRSGLLSSVSHDLRTPIAAITGAATTIRENPDLPTEVRNDMIATICGEAERLEHLVSNLLDMTRLESGAVRLSRDSVPLVEIVGGALNRLKKQLSAHRVVTHLPEDLAWISVDPVLMEQLFVNLLENAARYTPVGTEIEIMAAIEASNLLVEVRDRGPGIVPGEEDMIFDRFHRSSRAGPPGVGLGLSICRAIARVHGGSLSASNRADGGASFRLELPLIEAPAALPLDVGRDE
ncbi:MAG: sensor histidine kinase KdpD [Deltaproteobacteria bacterium]|nr:sensor histidine kinase KdpD [Deltaproteobacteria bacterium]